MADKQIILGPITAYGEAREGGYTGTKAEFEAGLARSANYATNAAQSATNAAASASTASTAASDATTAKTQAQNAASAAQTSQTNAEQSATAAREAATDAQTAKSEMVEEVADLKSDVNEIIDYGIDVLTPFTSQNNGTSAITSFRGMAVPIQDVSGIVKVKAKLCTVSATNVSCGIITAEDFTATSIVNVDFISTDTQAVGTTPDWVEFSFDNYYRASENGYVVFFITDAYASGANGISYTAHVASSEPVHDTTLPLKTVNNNGAITTYSSTTSTLTYSIAFTGYRQGISGAKISVENLGTYKMTRVYVAVNGSDSTGDGSFVNPYATIFHANEVITDATEDNRYTIIVRAGTYTDLQTRFSGLDVAGYNGKYQGVVCKDYVYYESENINRPDLCIIEWDGAAGLGTGLTYNTSVFTKCPFHISGDLSDNPNGLHTHVKGFTFNVKNCRYCFHTESANCGLNVEWEVENCVFNWGGRPDISTGNSNSYVVGCGFSEFEIGTFKRCVFNNSVGTEGLYAHNGVFKNTYGFTPFATWGGRLKILDCSFNNLLMSMQSIYPLSRFSSKFICWLENCKLIRSLTYTYGNGVTADNRAWEMVKSANTITTDNT